LSNDIPIRGPLAILSISRADVVAREIADLELRGQAALDPFNDIPRFSARVAFIALLTLARSPLRVLAAISRAKLGALLQPRHFVAIVSRLPQALAAADSFSRRGVKHIHALDDASAVLAFFIASLTRATVSVAEETSKRFARRARFVAPHDQLAALVEQHAVTQTTDDATIFALDWRALGATAVAVRWMTVRFDAAVAEVTMQTSDGARNVIVKQHRQEPAFALAAAERARNESEALARLSVLMSGHSTVPHVLHSDAVRTTLVLERVAGTSLDTFFASAAREPARLLDAIELAGAWLRAMQAATWSTSNARTLLDATIKTAMSDVALVASRDRVVHKQRRKIERALQSGRTNSAPFIVVGHHGDYWPGNIFIDGARVAVIDFEGFREGLPLEDVAYFLIRTELLSRRFRVNVPGLNERFLRGYGSKVDREALRLFTITKALRTLANETGANLPLPQRVWTRRAIRRALLRAVR
jgi:aminoglycoside phosphotransferase (APT) family kinase protein